ncbi:hypothetical protein ZHAS_00017756 [Anopheles sinensis]|uniref:Uncharacterized protein n=1 Tax=Anopheles sinensis TaxID=74873 RepID=A0A084WH54_ANOSI|nr:hypothetical protein ZHAS_00017756 [Anopheles sinensis]
MTLEIDGLQAVSGIYPMFHSKCAVDNGGCRNGTICLLSPRDRSGRICKQIVT